MKKITGWLPDEDQWWATGFNPDYTNPNPDEMTMICSVDLETEELYNGFTKTYRSDNEKIIFDDDYNMIWIMW